MARATTLKKTLEELDYKLKERSSQRDRITQLLHLKEASLPELGVKEAMGEASDGEFKKTQAEVKGLEGEFETLDYLITGLERQKARPPKEHAQMRIEEIPSQPNKLNEKTEEKEREICEIVESLRPHPKSLLEISAETKEALDEYREAFAKVGREYQPMPDGTKAYTRFGSLFIAGGVALREAQPLTFRDFVEKWLSGLVRKHHGPSELGDTRSYQGWGGVSLFRCERHLAKGREERKRRHPASPL